MDPKTNSSSKQGGFSLRKIVLIFSFFFLCLFSILILVMITIFFLPQIRTLSSEFQTLKVISHNLETNTTTISFLFDQINENNEYTDYPQSFTFSGGSGVIVPLSSQGEEFEIDGTCRCCLDQNVIQEERRGIESAAVCIIQSVTLFTFAISLLLAQKSSNEVLENECPNVCAREFSNSRPSGSHVRKVSEIDDELGKKWGAYYCEGQCKRGDLWVEKKDEFPFKEGHCSETNGKALVHATSLENAELSFQTGRLKNLCKRAGRSKRGMVKPKVPYCEPDEATIACAQEHGDPLDGRDNPIYRGRVR